MLKNIMVKYIGHKSILFILMCFVVVGMFSCKDYLSKDNVNKSDAESFYSDLTHTNYGLNAIYNVLYDDNMYDIQMEALRCDEGCVAYSRMSPTGSDALWYFQQYQTDDFSGKWKTCYKGILQCNSVLESLANLQPTLASAGDSTKFNNQLGQVHFFRGLFYFYLFNTYNNGSIVIQTKVPKTTEDQNQPLSPRGDVLALLRSDLKMAYDLLPYTYSTKVEDQGRVRKGAAATILATSYLYEAQYDSSLIYLNDVMKNPAYGYALVRDMKLLFTTAGKMNKESILEINFAYGYKPESSDWDETDPYNMLCKMSPIGGSNSAGQGLAPAAWLVYEYQHEALDSMDTRNKVVVDSVYNANKKFSMDTTVWRNVSLRTSAMMAVANDEDTPYYLYPSVTAAVNNWKSVIGFFKKYTNHDIVSSEADLKDGPNKSAKNITLNRLAEVYLMYAECKIKMAAQGSTATTSAEMKDALWAMNAIRDRWALARLGLPENAGETESGKTHTYDNKVYTTETLMNQLMFIDKPLELSIEGNAARWNDLRRWGIIKERFRTLSKEIYYGVNYKVRKASSIDNKNPKCYLKKVVDDDTRSEMEALGSWPIAGPYIDYQDAANSYVPSMAYFAIPNSERQVNHSIK